MNVKIFVACHNQLPIIKGEILEPIQVGKALSKLDLGILGDNTGDNISELNPYFCELTALYWIWKNSQNLDYVGLYHYRRFMAKTTIFEDFLVFIRKFKYFINERSFIDHEYYIGKQPISSLKKFNAYKLFENDMILPRKMYLENNLMEQFVELHGIADLDIIRNIILEDYYECKVAFDLVMEQKFLYPFNMFILRWQLFDSFCQWVFPILFKFYKEVDLTKRDSYQIRACGFISERLFNVFIKIQQLNGVLKIKEIPICRV